MSFEGLNNNTYWDHSPSLHWDRSIGREAHLVPELAPPEANPFSLGVDTTFAQAHFDVPRSHSTPHHHSSDTGMALKTGTKILKSKTNVLNNAAAQAAKHTLVALKAYQIGEKFVHNFEAAKAAGQSDLRAFTCESLRTGTEEFTKHTLQTAVVGVSAAAAEPYIAFTIANPPLIGTVPHVIDTVVKTYHAAEDMGRAAGDTVQWGCNKAFDAADAW